MEEFEMLLIPAIDIKEGQCVRVRQGGRDDLAVVSDDPVEVARHWVEQGARRLHVVDLDGTAQGRPVHDALVADIVAVAGEVPVQVGGGIRDEDAAQAYLDAGVEWLIIGTRAVNAPHFVKDLCVEYPGRIIIGLDARNGRIAIDGWSKLSNHDLIDLSRKLEEHGACAIVYTDVGRDGLTQGVNVEATAELARSINIPVIASGGIATLDDVRILAGHQPDGIQGVVLGRALYERIFSLADAQRLADDVGDGGFRE
jgi:phosphoribosylformimino-5-aminoimidazole carboxamide ribotide isomerase